MKVDNDSGVNYSVIDIDGFKFVVNKLNPGTESHARAVLEGVFNRRFNKKHYPEHGEVYELWKPLP